MGPTRIGWLRTPIVIALQEPLITVLLDAEWKLSKVSLNDFMPEIFGLNWESKIPKILHYSIKEK